jgi:hypothetical protein
MSTSDKLEQDALRALISASLRINEGDVSNEEVQLFLKHANEVPADYVAALNRLCMDIDTTFEEPAIEVSSSRDMKAASSDVLMSLYTAMNRKNAADKHSAETESELERKRQEILKKLLSKSEQEKDASD